MNLKDVPIKRKLTTIVMLTSGAVLLLTCTAFIVYEMLIFRKGMVNEVSTLAQVFVANSTPALLFGDEKTPSQYLSALHANPDIVQASIYDANGNLFAIYPANSPTNRFPALPEKSGHHFTREELTFYYPLMHDRARLGTLYIQSDLEGMKQRLRLYAGIVLLVLTGSFFVALILATWLQKSISKPIMHLAATARAVSEKRDYSVRARKFGHDELGQLTDTFNHMLTQIDERAAALGLSEQRYRSLIAAMTSIVWTTDAEGKFNSPQSSWEKYTGQPWSEQKDWGWLNVIHPDDQEKIKKLWNKSLADHGLFEFNGRLRHATSGQHRYFEARAVPLLDKNGGVREWVGTVSDVHDRKTAEDEIRILNAELEQRVLTRTSELAASTKEMEAFTYSVSHDLRAPLRHIVAFGEILLEDFAPKLEAAAQDYVQRIMHGARNMSHLVDDLLNLAKIGRHELLRQPTDLNLIIDEVIAELQPELAGRKVEWKIARLSACECDPGLMRQVFANLISNSVKYTGPREIAVIEIGQLALEKESPIFIRDNGVGFDMKFAGKLFGVFQRLHRDNEFEGTGVGLATVERIVRKHGGRIWAEADTEHGATFYFTLDCREKSQAA